MTKERYVIDTNVLVAANDRLDGQGKEFSIDCRSKAVEFLQQIKSGIVLLDHGGAVRNEYEGNLRQSGQLGAGDRFYMEFSRGQKIEEIELPEKDGEYQDLPQEIISAGFERDDRKFAALAKKENVPVANVADANWVNHFALLWKHGICVLFVCGQKPLVWLGSSERDLKEFPGVVRDKINLALAQARLGLKSKDAKPFKGLGPRILEIVERHAGNAYRAIYAVRCKDVVHVLHVFQKKAKRGIAMAKQDVDKARQRLGSVQQHCEKMRRN